MSLKPLKHNAKLTAIDVRRSYADVVWRSNFLSDPLKKAANVLWPACPAVECQFEPPTCAMFADPETPDPEIVCSIFKHSSSYGSVLGIAQTLQPVMQPSGALAPLKNRGTEIPRSATKRVPKF
jgi:hypothetical protein